MMPAHPERIVRASRGGPFIAVFLGLLAVPSLYVALFEDRHPLVERIAVGAFGALLAWISLRGVWDWAVGGEARLFLAQDPVTHGQWVPVTFELARSVAGREWSVKVSMLGPAERGSGFGTTWSETFPVQPTGDRELSTSIFIPRHATPTRASRGDELHVGVLMLKSGSKDWTFSLQTQAGP